MLNYKVEALSRTIRYFTYRGIYSDTGEYNTGDIVTNNGSEYVYISKKWEPLRTNEEKQYKQTHCKSCGAPLKIGMEYCEYCGTARES